MIAAAVWTLELSWVPENWKIVDGSKTHACREARAARLIVSTSKEEFVIL